MVVVVMPAVAACVDISALAGSAVFRLLILTSGYWDCKQAFHSTLQGCPVCLFVVYVAI